MDTGSLLGKVIYEEEKIKKIWDEINNFINSFEDCKFKEKFKIKAANVCKLFYKTKKWKDEMEIRVACYSSEENSLNIRKKDNIIIFKPSILCAFNKIYSKKENIDKIKNKATTKYFFKESLDIANYFIHLNEGEKIPKLEDLFKELDNFK